MATRRRPFAIALSASCIVTVACGFPQPPNISAPVPELTSFAFLANHNAGLQRDVTATIVASGVTAALPFGTARGALHPTFTTNAASVTVQGTPQVSDQTANDFTVPVTYTLVGDDGTSADYVVTVASPTLSPRFDFAVGMGPTSVAVGDLNGDGKVDIVVANQISNNVTVLLNTTATGGTTPTFTTKVEFMVGTRPTGIVVADLNSDGRPDLATANLGADTISVLLNLTVANTSTPAFTAATAFGTGGAPTNIAAGDVNTDGKPDLVVTNQGATTVSVLLDTTATSSTTPSLSNHTDFATGSAPVAIVVADLNDDGKPDLAVSNMNAASVSILLDTTATGAGTPTMASKVDFTVGGLPIAAAIGDLNADGKRDLAIANSGSDSVSVLFNTTAPSATPVTTLPKSDFPTGTGPYSVAIGDLDQDGQPDLVIANRDAHTISVLIGTTPGGATVASFSAKVDFAVGAQTPSVAIGDFNGDGKTDLVATNENAATVSVLLAQ